MTLSRVLSRAYTSPKSVWLYPTFGAAEKCLYGDILSYTPTGSTKDIRDYAQEFDLSRAAVKRAIAQLLASGFIGKRKLGKYVEYFATPSKKEGVGGDSYNIEDSSSSSSITKEELPIAIVIDIAYPWAEVEFAEAWQMWNDERRERKTRKYTRRGEQAALHKLYNESGGDVEVAIKMIHQSVANGWQGIFPIEWTCFNIMTVASEGGGIGSSLTRFIWSSIILDPLYLVFHHLTSFAFILLKDFD